MDQQLVNSSAGDIGLGLGQSQHNDTEDVGALDGDSGGGGTFVVDVMLEEHEDEVYPRGDVCDSVLPPVEELLMGERGDEGGDGVVVGNGGGVEGGDVGDELGVLGRDEGDDCAWAGAGACCCHVGGLFEAVSCFCVDDGEDGLGWRRGEVWMLRVSCLPYTTTFH